MSPFTRPGLVMCLAYLTQTPSTDPEQANLEIVRTLRSVTATWSDLLGPPDAHDGYSSKLIGYGHGAQLTAVQLGRVVLRHAAALPPLVLAQAAVLRHAEDTPDQHAALLGLALVAVSARAALEQGYATLALTPRPAHSPEARA